MSKLYYETPKQEIFDEVKEKAIKVWENYDNTYGYATEKIDQIVNLKNIKDNIMFIVAMFDSNNQRTLSFMLSEEARQAIHDRIISGGGKYSQFGEKNVS